MQKKEEFYILNVLRGLGASLVIFYHFFVFFFDAQPFSAGLLNIEPLELAEPIYFSALNTLPIDIGHLGVSFFFLISGFLIQPSLAHSSTLMSFMRHKFFRLWPTYAACFSIGLVFVFLFAYLRQTPFPYTLPHVLSYFFWVRDLFHFPYIDGAVWTLEIQLKFYLFVGLIWFCWKGKFLEKTSTLLMFLTLLTWYAFIAIPEDDEALRYGIYLTRMSLKFFILMNMGSYIYSYYKKEISLSKFVLFMTLLLLVFISPLTKETSFIKTNAYLLGVVVFFVSIFYLKKTFGQQGWIGKGLGWVSRISYPLYIGHVLPGYTILFYSIESGLNPYFAACVSVICSFCIASLVHKKVEIPFASKR